MYIHSAHTYTHPKRRLVVFSGYSVNVLNKIYTEHTRIILYIITHLRTVHSSRFVMNTTNTTNTTNRQTYTHTRQRVINVNRGAFIESTLNIRVLPQNRNEFGYVWCQSRFFWQLHNYLRACLRLVQQWQRQPFHASLNDLFHLRHNAHLNKFHCIHAFTSSQSLTWSMYSC